MSKTDLNNLKNIIKRLIIKDISVDFSSDQSDFKVVLTDHDYRVIKKEAEKISMNKYELDKLIDEVKSEINFVPNLSEKQKIVPTDLKLGQHIRLITKDEKGEAIEELIYIGEYNFLLIKHERGSLQLLDKIKTETSPWNIGGHIDFQVYRKDKRVVKNESLSIYRTKKILNIQLLIPQFDFERFYKDKLSLDEVPDK